MKNLKSIVLLCGVLLLAACEKTEEISGDSSLKIINECGYGVKIYFDDTNLGRIESDENKTWSVPSGDHVIKATCSFLDDYEETHSFTAGMTTTIRLQEVSKYKQKSSLGIF